MNKIKSITHEYDLLPESFKNHFEKNGWGKGNPFFFSIKSKRCSIYSLQHDWLCFMKKYGEKVSALQPYIDIYGAGFDEGYSSFIRTIKAETNELLTADNETYSRAVFLRTKRERGMLMNCFYGVIDKERCYNFGKLAGEYYKAWEIIFKNPGQFERFFTEAKETQNDEELTDLICDQKHLQRLHAEYDGEIWESVTLDEFLNSMRTEPIGTLKPQVKNEEFAKWIFDNIDEHRKGKKQKGKKPNMSNWFKKLVGKGLNYSTLKNM